MSKKKTLPDRFAFMQILHVAHPNIFPPDEFKELVKTERIRSDRNGSAFSIVVFYLPTEDEKSQTEILLRISKTVRAIDCIGWDGEGHISVFLPDTREAGARIFGRKIVTELVKLEDNGILFDVYSYPDTWLANEKTEPAEAAAISREIDSLFITGIPEWKRKLDVSLSCVLLVMTSPILLAVGTYIKLVSPGPVFFKQTRIGYRGVPFTFWKFRTMHIGNNQDFHGKHSSGFIRDGDKPMEKLDNYDPRIIPGGKIIRKSCLDELPQLWNVIRGDMSLVGPRPCIPYEAEEYLRWHTHRFDTLPGMSGLWQVSGKNKLTFKQMIRLDITYCEHISLFGDIAIIIRTPFAILWMLIESMARRFASSPDVLVTEDIRRQAVR